MNVFRDFSDFRGDYMGIANPVTNRNNYTILDVNEGILKIKIQESPFSFFGSYPVMLEGKKREFWDRIEYGDIDGIYGIASFCCDMDNGRCDQCVPDKGSCTKNSYFEPVPESVPLIELRKMALRKIKRAMRGYLAAISDVSVIFEHMLQKSL